MPQWFGKDKDWDDVRRISTGIGARKRVGVGHDPVTLDANADTVLDIGAVDLPQELGLDEQAANTVWAGPAAGANDYPGFRALVGDDLGSLLPQPVAQGDLLIADGTPEWDILTLGAAAGYALVTTATTAEWNQTPTWTGAHQWESARNALTDLSDPANYHALFYNPANDDDEGVGIGFYISSGANDVGAGIIHKRTGGNSKGELRFYTKQTTDDATDPALVLTLDDAGDAAFANDVDIGDHCAIGDGASVQTDTILYVYEAIGSGSERLAVDAFAIAEPGSNFSDNWRGVVGTARLDTAQTQTSGLFAGVYGKALIKDSIAGTANSLIGGLFLTDAEDGTATAAHGVYAYTPLVDSGTATTGYGVRIVEGTVGAGSITTLYGLHIAAISAGGTNYSIYTAGGDHYLGDDVEIDGVLTLKEQAEPADPSAGAGIIWLSDGTGAGDEGDIMMKSNQGGTTKTDTLLDWSTL